jgi:transposase
MRGVTSFLNPGEEENQAKEAELFQQIGKLQMELEWLKKKSQLL